MCHEIFDLYSSALFAHGEFDLNPLAIGWLVCYSACLLLVGQGIYLLLLVGLLFCLLAIGYLAVQASELPNLFSMFQQVFWPRTKEFEFSPDMANSSGKNGAAELDTRQHCAATTWTCFRPQNLWLLHYVYSIFVDTKTLQFIVFLRVNVVALLLSWSYNIVVCPALMCSVQYRVTTRLERPDRRVFYESSFLFLFHITRISDCWFGFAVSIIWHFRSSTKKLQLIGTAETGGLTVT